MRMYLHDIMLNILLSYAATGICCCQEDGTHEGLLRLSRGVGVTTFAIFVKYVIV